MSGMMVVNATDWSTPPEGDSAGASPGGGDAPAVMVGRAGPHRAIFAGRPDSNEGTVRRYHHIGIPTTARRRDETYLPEYKVFVSGFERSPYGIEWMRFEPGCPLPELIQTVPHVAFQVPDLEAAIAGMNVLIAPNSPSPGIRVAFIVDDGAPIELLEIDDHAPSGPGT
jgi:hypothetical protein